MMHKRKRAYTSDVGAETLAHLLSDKLELWQGEVEVGLHWFTVTSPHKLHLFCGVTIWSKYMLYM